MARYIIDGEQREIEKIIRENRIRINRGKISISPVEPGTAYDEDMIETLREVAFSNQEALRESTAAHIELAQLTSDVITIAVENGVSIPAELARPLAEKFSIDVPKNEKIAENDAVIAENDVENVPKNEKIAENDAVIAENDVENVPKNESPEVIDDKQAGEDDIVEVDLDADDKAIAASDAKTAPAADAKQTVKRSKK